MAKLICLLFCTQLWAATPRVQKLRSELTQKSLKVSELASKIRTLDKSISTSNNEYLGKIEQIKEVGEQLSELSESLVKSKLALEKSVQVASHNLKMNILEHNDDNDIEAIASERILQRALMINLEELAVAQSKNEDLEKKVQEISALLTQLKDKEAAIYTFILDLENEKNQTSDQYVNELERKNILEEKLTDQKTVIQITKKSPKSKLKPVAALPLAQFDSYKGSTKGVTFNIKGVHPVTASQRGVVVYSGDLAAYGKIVMLDHGSDLRSLVLGDLKINVKKGQELKAGDVLGYTIGDNRVSKKLYFEIRKKNKVQNTLSYLQNKKLL